MTGHALADAETATLTHTVTGGNYGMVTATLDVAVMNAPMTISSGSAPAFLSPRLPAQTYREWQQVRVPLPAAIIGTAPFTYTLTPALPAGLRYDGATPQVVKVGTFRAPVQFRRVSGAEVLSQSEFEIPLRRLAPRAGAPTRVRVTEADSAAPVPPVETALQAAAAAWT